jgi:uncharacterized RDD family membrane protein YckC
VTTFPAYATADLSGHGRRLAAAALDAVAYALVVGGCAVVGFLAGLAGGATTDDSSDGWEELGWILLGTVLGIVVGIVCWLVLIVWLVRRPGARNGQTIGKQLVGIRAARVDGTPIGVGTALLREVLAKGLLIGITSSLVSGLLGFVDGGSIGLVVAVAVWYGPAFADEQRRALHDRMLGTRVVVAKPGVAAPAPTADELWPATP